MLTTMEKWQQSTVVKATATATIKMATCSILGDNNCISNNAHKTENSNNQPLAMVTASIKIAGVGYSISKANGTYKKGKIATTSCSDGNYNSKRCRRQLQENSNKTERKEVVT